MARMPDIEAEAWAAVQRGFRWIGEEAEHLAHPGEHPYAAQAPAGMPVNITATEGEPVINPAELRAFADRLEHIGEEGLAKTEAILGNPDTAELFGILHALTGVNVGPVLTAVKTILAPYVPAPAAPDGQPAA